MSTHGGDIARFAAIGGCLPEEITDFSVNLNPCGIPDGVFKEYFAAFDDLHRYPEPDAAGVNRFLAEHWGIFDSTVQAGNGAGGLLFLLPMCVNARRAVLVAPCFNEYERVCRAAGIPVEYFILDKNEDFAFTPDRLRGFLQPGDLVIIGNPANPTGMTTAPEALLQLIDSEPEVNFIIDEAFADFVPEISLVGKTRDNLAVVRSLTKFYALPGLRMGYVVAGEKWIARLREIMPPWLCGAAECRLMPMLLEQKDFAVKSIAKTERLRSELTGALADIDGIKVYPGRADFILFECGVPELFERLLKEYHIAVRQCSDYVGLGESFYRIAVKDAASNAKLIAALRRIVAPGVVFAPSVIRKRKIPALMFQGTCSNAGKSILTAGFCRVMLEDGYSVAPFKAQNMALNSFVTADGGEIGRAQAVQADACRIDPDVRMNPVLLKPESDHASQIIVLGHAIGKMRAKEYFTMKHRLFDVIKESYDTLAEGRDAMIIEGAGSPGEVNLKKNDIVNMRMAEYADARVMLAGDIDRGGVYAAFAGIYATLEDWERRLLRGFIVNKFRGDASLLEPAHRYIEELTGKPVLGVVDYLPDLELPEEDSVNFSFVRQVEKFDRTLDMVIVQLGRIANFTDFTPFEGEPDVTVRKVASPDDFGNPDIVVVPGSKSVAADYQQLLNSGLKEKICAAVKRGAFYIGICGGLQLAGMRLLDPDAVESDITESPMLGLIDIETVMGKKKILRQERGLRGFFAGKMAGYEIHNGVSSCLDPDALICCNKLGDLVAVKKERLFCTYLHGVFDDDTFRRDYINSVRVVSGMAPLPKLTHYGIEDSLNLLAAHIRERVDVNRIYKQMGLK